MRNIGTSRASVKRTLSRGVEVAREGTPQNVRFGTPFITGERVQSVKMNFSIEKTGNDISEHNAQFYSEEDAKVVRMREAGIRTFMQLELEACLEEINWIKHVTTARPSIARKRSIRRGYLFRRTMSTIRKVD